VLKDENLAHEATTRQVYSLNTDHAAIPSTGCRPRSAQSWAIEISSAETIAVDDSALLKMFHHRAGLVHPLLYHSHSLLQAIGKKDRRLKQSILAAVSPMYCMQKIDVQIRCSSSSLIISTISYTHLPVFLCLCLHSSTFYTYTHSYLVQTYLSS
jgi:hypothetical protein